jgi:MFS transporter, DHA2 family, multidrug resistance protein
LKFRFALKPTLIATASGLIVCNIIVLNVHSIPVLVAVSFVAGILRMWGTFACNSTIQLWITPKRDMSVWFCYIQGCVQGFILLTGLTTIYFSFLSKWEYMHWFIIGALFVLIVVVFVSFRHFRSMPKVPLYGIDWFGGAMWAAVLLSVVFVLNYGEHYDWFHSSQIRIGTAFALIALVLTIWRATFVDEPYIANETWRFRNVWLTFLFYIPVNLLVSPSHLFEYMYTETILGYDSLHVVSLNWVILLGMIVGAFFMWRTFAIRKWTYKTTTLIGFSLITGYLLVMYFSIDYNLPKEMLIFPLILRSVGYIIISITFITALTGIPFKNFPQTLTIQSFMSAGAGALMGEAVLTQIFKYTMKKNVLMLGTNFDSVNTNIAHTPSEVLYGVLQKQAMLLSIKEIYGWLFVAGIIILMIFLLKESTLRPKFLHPKFSTIRRDIKHSLKLRKAAQIN